MRILVTGAEGFTGVHFCAAARAQGHEAVPLAAQLQDAVGLAREVRAIAPEAVVHLAAISFVGHGSAADFYTVNTVGTVQLLDALDALPLAPRCVLLASSANVYGNNPHSPIDEDAELAPANHYAASKAAMELLARRYVPRLPIVITRPFNYIGAGQNGQFVIPKIVDHFARRAPVIELGNLEVLREYNPVSFVCAAYLHLLEYGAPGSTWNICSGISWSLHQIIDMLREMTSHHPEIRVNPTLVRPNEVHRLCGDPGRLQESFARQAARWPLEGWGSCLGLRSMIDDALADARIIQQALPDNPARIRG